MRTATLHTRSVAVAEATAAAYASTMAVVAFGKFVGLIINDDWLAPLLIAILLVFAAECLLANRLGTLNWSQVSGLLTLNALLVLAVALGFTVQRMNINDANALPWGHYMIGGAVFYLLAYRFARVLREMGIYLGPYEAMLMWIEKALGGPMREALVQRSHEEGKVEGLVKGGKAGWRAAREEYFDTGSVGPPPKTKELSGILPAVKVESDPEIEKPEECK